MSEYPLEERFKEYRLQNPGESFFTALRAFTGYTKLYGKRKDGAFEELEAIPEKQFPNTL